MTRGAVPRHVSRPQPRTPAARAVFAVLALVIAGRDLAHCGTFLTAVVPHEHHQASDHRDQTVGKDEAVTSRTLPSCRMEDGLAFEASPARTIISELCGAPGEQLPPYLSPSAVRVSPALAPHRSAQNLPASRPLRV